MGSQDPSNVVPLFGTATPTSRQTPDPSIAQATWQWRDVLPQADYEHLLQLIFGDEAVEADAA